MLIGRFRSAGVTVGARVGLPVGEVGGPLGVGVAVVGVAVVGVAVVGAFVALLGAGVGLAVGGGVGVGTCPPAQSVVPVWISAHSRLVHTLSSACERRACWKYRLKAHCVWCHAVSGKK